MATKISAIIHGRMSSNSEAVSLLGIESVLTTEAGYGEESWVFNPRCRTTGVKTGKRKALATRPAGSALQVASRADITGDPAPGEESWHRAQMRTDMAR